MAPHALSFEGSAAETPYRDTPSGAYANGEEEGDGVIRVAFAKYSGLFLHAAIEERPLDCPQEITI